MGWRAKNTYYIQKYTINSKYGQYLSSPRMRCLPFTKAIFFNQNAIIDMSLLEVSAHRKTFWLVIRFHLKSAPNPRTCHQIIMSVQNADSIRYWLPNWGDWLLLRCHLFPLQVLEAGRLRLFLRHFAVSWCLASAAMPSRLDLHI